MDSVGEITKLLRRISAGDELASDELARVAYTRLHAVANRIVNGKAVGETLRPTALVNEGFLKLLKSNAIGEAQDRHHFFALAGRAMRQVLVDHARAKATEKRNGYGKRVSIDLVLNYFHQRRWDLLALDDAMELLALQDPRGADVVHMRFFAGMTMPEVADSLEVSLSTVEGDWRVARAFLHSQLVDDD